jgi:hypothetical protein
MPFFKSTYNILTKCDEDEVFESKYETSGEVLLPPKKDWNYQRTMQIEDVDIWEVIYEGSGGIGMYAAWQPYAEFYLLTTGINFKNGPHYFKNNSTGPDTIPYWSRNIETFYGPEAGKKAYHRASQLGIPIHVNTIWVDDDEMWLHQPAPETKKFEFNF